METGIYCRVTKKLLVIQFDIAIAHALPDAEFDGLAAGFAF